jgi:hypothetical protein
VKNKVDAYEIKRGYTGGGTTYGLGYLSDMVLFFDCIRFYIPSKYPNENFDIILDRLYKRYLKLEELDEAAAKMKLIEEVFKTLPRDAVDWKKIDNGSIKSDLNTHQDTLFDIFKGYFEKFYECVYGTKYSYEYSQIYQPTKVSPTGIIERHYYSGIPLSELDRLGKDDKPFWQLPWYEYAHLGTNRDKSENLIFKNTFVSYNIIRYKSRFLKKVIKETVERQERLPLGGIQKIIIYTKQKLTQEQENMIKNEIVEKTNGAVTFDNTTIEILK